jgi:predicted outer membrane repeat protein
MKSGTLRKVLFSAILFSLLIFTKLQAQVIYVNIAATGANNGTSWINAYTNFQSGVNAATTGYSVWVARGTYQPASSGTFSMKSNVKIYGGFIGNENTLTARNWVNNPTILKGNNNTVITNSNINANALLDGFTVRDGLAVYGAGGMSNTGSSPSIVNVNFINNTATFENSYGGGMFNQTSSNPTITNCTFSGNKATVGGGMSNYNSSNPIITNCTFSGNIGNTGAGMSNTYTSSPKLTNVIFSNNTGISTSACGAGLYCETGSNPTITNAVFSGNIGGSDNFAYAGGLYDNGGISTLTNVVFVGNQCSHGGAIAGKGTYINCTFLNNTATFGTALGGAIYNSTGATITNCIFFGNLSSGTNNDIIGSGTVSYSLTQTSIFASATNKIITVSPFINQSSPAGADGIFMTADDGLKLIVGSPAINKGNNAAVPAAVTTDVTGSARIVSIVDMGAYESPYDNISRWYVDSANISGTYNGLTWATAFNKVESALTIADYGDSIWVANGTYKPPVNTSYQMKSDVKLYGGFSGNETTLAARNWLTNFSVLKGNNTRVIANTNVNSNASLDGFIVAGGSNAAGAGLYNVNSSPIITNCTFFANVANGEGGAIFQDGGKLTITKNIFSQNTATSGGAIRLHTISGGTDPSITAIGNVFYKNISTGNDASALSLVMGAGIDTLINNLFAQNTTTTATGTSTNGGCLVQENGTSSYIVNNTFYANSASASSGAIRFKSGGTNRYVYNNLFYKSFNGTDATDLSLEAGTVITGQDNNNASTTNPLFVNESNLIGTDNLWGTADDGLTLNSNSPAINNGDNTKIPAAVTTDITGAQRILNSTIDEGAYENEICTGSTTLYVDSSIAVSGNGKSWGGAFKTLSQAMAFPCTNITQILVAKGTYYPTGNQNGTDRTVSFKINRNNLKLTGGYPAGGGTQNITANPTILSGDIGVANNATDNSYHVVTVIAYPVTTIDNSVVINGFTITKGNANGSVANDIVIYTAYIMPSSDGGGLYVFANGTGYSANPVITNCIFINNNSSVDGGAVETDVTQTTGEIDFTNCQFSQNTSGSKGGAISGNAILSVTNSNFYNNTATGEGGTIMQDGAKLTIKNNSFVQGAAIAGGAIRLHKITGFTDPSITAINNVFYKNISTSNDGGALSLVMNTGKDTIINNLFVQNKAIVAPGNDANGGGAIVQENGTITYIVNNTFYGDTAASLSGAIRFKSAGTNRYLYNNIFYKSYNGTDNTDVSLEAGTAITGQGNNSLSGLDPRFVNENNIIGADGIFMTADDGLKLTGCSPLLNIGNNSFHIVSTDINNQSRIFNSTIDPGAYEYQSAPTSLSLAVSNDIDGQLIISGLNNLLVPNNCSIIAQLLPSGSNPVTGNVFSEVWIDNSVQNYNGQPYVERHYDITPATNASSSTATITLFFTQAEFDTLNIYSTVKLPTGPLDAAGIANLNVMQFHGTSATGVPGTYSGSTETIDPADGNIVWNNTLSRWEITFNVSSFSGFIVVPVGGTVLSLNLLSFTGTLSNDNTDLQWQTANEQNTSHFEIDKSIDGVHFDSLTIVQSVGTGNNSYAAIDPQTQIGSNYYRLKSVDNDGSYFYSNIVLINKSTNQQTNTLLVYPNPTSNQLIVRYDNEKNAVINIYSLAGQKVLTISTNGQSKTPIDVSRLSAGTYIVEYNNDTNTIRDKFVKVN